MSTGREDLWAEIESEQAWRQAELRFLQNCANKQKKKGDADHIRRAYIVMLYAHMEGFARFAFMHYVKSINGERVCCSQAHAAIATAHLADVFAALQYTRSKESKVFKRDLPDDSKLYRRSREIEFLDRIREFELRTVSLDDNVVDFESNLKPAVLRKNLYQLGLDYKLFESIEGNISKLLNLRNKIAHGSRQSAIEKTECDELRDAVFEFMDTLKKDIMAAIESKDYLRTNRPVTAFT